MLDSLDVDCDNSNQLVSTEQVGTPDGNAALRDLVETFFDGESVIDGAKLACLDFNLFDGVLRVDGELQLDVIIVLHVERSCSQRENLDGDHMRRKVGVAFVYRSSLKNLYSK